MRFDRGNIDREPQTTAETASLACPRPGRIEAALERPNGARFHRCALQVNPFAYVYRRYKKAAFTLEDAYNKAIVKTCIERGIEVIAVMDHYRVKHSASLVHAAREAGMFAFSGFEAVTKDGVHFLCLFSPDKDDVLDRFIGECGHNTGQPTPTGSLGSIELLESSKKWGGSLHRRPCGIRRRPAEEVVGTTTGQCLDKSGLAGLRAARSRQRCPGRNQAYP